MYRLHMADGTVKDVTYEQAKSIKSMLDGVTFPKDDKQRAFLNEVASVEMTAPKPVKERRTTGKVSDPELAKIMADKTLKGAEKARAVADYIKKRKGVS
jgi:hypothetical protein